MEDYAISRAVLQPDIADELRSKINGQPDIIHVEQPWLFEFAKQYRDVVAPKAALIYSSQNCEWLLKKAILQPYVRGGELKQCIENVRDCEVRAVTNADGVITVTADNLLQLGIPTPKAVLIANNGVDPLATHNPIVAPQSLLDVKKYALYCASAHPPNMEGFFEMLGHGFGCLDSDQLLIVAGGAGPHIEKDPRLRQSANLADRLGITGIVGESALQFLVRNAHAIIIPITVGSGTNLKTAEALISEKYVVATPVGMRGFEEFITAKGVRVCATPAEFKNALRDVMQLSPLQLTKCEQQQRGRVSWNFTLKGVPNFARSLVPSAES